LNVDRVVSFPKSNTRSALVAAAMFAAVIGSVVRFAYTIVVILLHTPM
jgi:hypothetical protein